jgi:hypothetical protein
MRKASRVAFMPIERKLRRRSRGLVSWRGVALKLSLRMMWSGSKIRGMRGGFGATMEGKGRRRVVLGCIKVGEV